MKKEHSQNIFLVLAYIFLLMIISLACGTVEPKDNIDLALTSAAATITSGAPSDLILPTLPPAPTLVPTITASPGTCTAEGRVNSINMRRSPSGDVIGCCLSAGEDVEIQEVDEKGEWALIAGIEKPSHQGWVKMSLLNVTGTCDLVSETLQK